MSNQLNFLHSTLLTEQLYNNNLHKNWVVAYHLFRALFVSTSIHLSRLINVYITSTISVKQPTSDRKLRALFQGLREAGLKLSTAKWHFRVQEIDVIGRKITTNGVAPQKQKTARFVKKKQISTFWKSHFNATLDLDSFTKSTYLDWQND